jgi:hypothetical protein
LTYRPHDVESARQANADEIEITPEMVNAGCDRYFYLTFHEECVERIVREVFLAMMRACAESLSQKLASKR